MPKKKNEWKTAMYLRRSMDDNHPDLWVKLSEAKEKIKLLEETIDHLEKLDSDLIKTVNTLKTEYEEKVIEHRVCEKMLMSRISELKKQRDDALNREWKLEKKNDTLEGKLNEYKRTTLRASNPLKSIRCNKCISRKACDSDPSFDCLFKSKRKRRYK